MTQGNPQNSGTAKVLTARRITLLASVAAIGAAVLLAGPGNYWPSGLAAGTLVISNPTDAVQENAVVEVRNR